jgi:hypothetical protein
MVSRLLKRMELATNYMSLLLSKTWFRPQIVWRASSFLEECLITTSPLIRVARRRIPPQLLNALAVSARESLLR